MTIKYVLRDVESGEYLRCYWDDYEIDGEEYTELVTYSVELEFADTYETWHEAEYYKNSTRNEFGYNAEIVRIGE